MPKGADSIKASIEPQTAALAAARSRGGLIYGVSAYTIWGFIPVYFRSVSHVPSSIVLCHRIIWSAIVVGLVVSFRKEWRPVLEALRTRRNIVLLLTGAVLMALNWLIFIYAVASRQVLQASLGYFINPLLSIALGMIFLRERLRPGQWLAVFIAAVAVANLAIRSAGFPWIALSLAGSFGFYGLVRKKVDIHSLHGLLVESAVLVPAAAVGLAILPTSPLTAGTWGLLSLSGIVTAVPLLFFGAALRRLSLSTMGFLQYVGPSLQFSVAILLFREPMDPVKLASFALCWLAIAVYVVDSIRQRYPQEVADQPD